MKRTLAILVSAGIALSLAACGGKAPQTNGASETQAAGTESQTAANPLESVISKAQADFSDTAQKLLDEQQKMFGEVGDTYEGYLQNIDKVQAWYDLAVDETEQLGARAVEYGREYYQAVVDNVDVTDDRDVERATEDFYDAIYEDAYEDYYDAIYEDAFDNSYDTFYDGVLQDAYDTTPYDEWFDVHSDAYEALSDARSDVYDAISDGRSDIYSDYTDVRSAFYNNDFDVQALFAPVEIVDNTQSGEASEQTEEDTIAPADGSADSGDAAASVSPDFKATMDSYEAFFDEYVEFMNAYQADPTSTDLIAKSANMMTQYADTMSAMNSIDQDGLSSADYAYYAEVTARIVGKLASVGQ